MRPGQDASYAFDQVLTSDFGCRDRGGSSLVSCQADAARSGATLDTMTPGPHPFTVQATDRSGNLTSVTRTYHVGEAGPTAGAPVAPPPVLRRPDGLIHRYPNGRQVGGNVYGSSARQGVHQAVSPHTRSASAVVRFENDRNSADRILAQGTTGSRTFRVRYLAGGTDVTRRVTAGTYRTPSLLPGRGWRLFVRVTRTGTAVAGDHRTIRLRGTAVGDTRRRDAVRTFVHATR